MSRAVSTVVGVALLAGVTVVALAALTASVGTVVETQADRTDSRMVADTMERIEPAATTGASTERLAFSEGEMSTASREFRVLDGGTLVVRERLDALVYESGSHRVVFLGGAVLRANGESAWFVRDPRVTATDGERGTVLVVGTAAIEGSVAATGRTDARLRTTVTHSRRTIDGGTVTVAIETATPRPWAEYFEEKGATVERRDIDGDGTTSVVATFETAETHLVVHRVEVSLDG